MTEPPIIILLTHDTPAFVLDGARALSPHVRFITRDALERDPALLEQVEVSFGVPRPEWWTQMRALRWVQASGAGADRWLVPKAAAHPAVFTAAHIHAEPIAEHLFALLLAFTRKLLPALHQQAEHRWAGLGDPEVLSGKTLGLVGVGVIGRRAAELGAAFGMRVLGMRRSGGPAPHVERMYTPEQKAELLPLCDVLMLTIPLTPRTRCFLGPEEFALLKPGALLFNIGRGKTVDTQALLDALHSGRLAGAGLDVTDPEPLPPNHPLWDAPNVLITPHNSGSQPDYGERAGDYFLANLRRYLAGQPLEGVIDKAEGY